ncbi:mannosyl-oligosaccharide alpha-1,2-mannosidase IA [Eurosta solidaginis]|uniref:mannosyl-oligosaccharide alpha-1,2-mannosidase IA n=1 Tax=Eurosta solidaginis TaxID=178769 RepID=UPI003531493F
MCTKISKTPLFLIGGVCFVIVLVGITGVTLINNLNLSNIIKLNEKVASDSMSAPHDTELNDDDDDDEDVSDADINYANNHPKNIYKFDEISAPYALAVGTYAHSSVISPSASQLASLATALGASESTATPHIIVKSTDEMPQNMQQALAGETLTLIGHPVVALIDTEANNGNMMSETVPQTQRQQNMNTSANWLKVNGKLLSSNMSASSGVNNITNNTRRNESVVEKLLHHPQVNVMQSNAPTALTSGSFAKSVNASSFTNETKIRDMNSYYSTTPTTSAASTSATLSTSSLSSVNGDIAAKLMLPLILNGSARITQNINIEKQSDETDGSWGFPTDDKQTNQSDKFSTRQRVGTSGYLMVPSGAKGNDEGKRDYVKKMMLHAWENYKLYAWGKNELRPLSQRPHSGSIFGTYDLGATIVDGLDTLYLMGLNKEYQEGRDWIERKFSLDNISADLSVFETNIRFVGGMLTLYAFTGDPLYKEKAQHIADKLLPAFQTPTGIPYALVNTRTGVSRNYGWASGGSSILSEVGTLHCEFVYLSDITGNPLYRERVQTIRQVLKEIEKPKGLYPNFINPKTGKWGQMHMSLGALGDSYYEYLLKAWLQSGQTDEEAREMFDEAMLAINEHMIRTSNGGLTYASDLKFDRLEHKMDHLACFAGGLFALAASTRQNQHANKFMEIGKGLTNTCHESYARTSTKLGPEAFRFSDAAEARALKSQEKYYILRPETIESYFVLWRLTHDQKYRDWGWEAVQALETHCRTPHGYCGIKNVYQESPQKDDVQQSFFLAETLKYLYLLFSDDSILPLDEWIFNTEAHPLPIRSANAFYRAAAPPLTQQADETR